MGPAAPDRDPGTARPATGRRRHSGRRRLLRVAAVGGLLVAALALQRPLQVAAADRSKDPGPTPAPERRGKDAETPPPIEMHVGVRGIAYLGQPIAELRRRFPKAALLPLSKQNDAAMFTAAEAGISCYVVGATPDSLRVASAGFVLDGPYEGAQESGFRTREGIGKGSTVNDLLATYGPPTEIADGRRKSSGLLAPGHQEDPNAPKQYHYASADGKIKTYFVVEGSRVTRVVIVEIEPINTYLLKQPAPQ